MEKVSVLFSNIYQQKIKLMKKQIVNFALIAAIIGSIAAGCGSSKSAAGSDTTKKDTSKMTPPPPAKIDTMKKDTTHH
jgi:hypothetical protein